MNAEYPFLNDYPIPDGLLRIYKYLEDGNSSGLEFFVPKRGKERLESLVGKKNAAELVPIFTMANGGVIAAWKLKGESELGKMPIVWIDSEGSPNDVFAENIDALISLLHYYLGYFYDILKANKRHSDNPSMYKPATVRFPNEEFLRTAVEKWGEDSDLEEFHLWLEENSDIPREQSPVEKIVKANQMFPQFQDFIDGKMG
jgi:hypothetical protein